MDNSFALQFGRLGFAEKLAALMDERSLTPYALAKMSHLTESAIWNLQHKPNRKARPSTKKKLADALGVPVAELEDEPSTLRENRIEYVVSSNHDQPRSLRGREVPVSAVVVGGARGEAGDPIDEKYFLSHHLDDRGYQVIRLYGDSMSPELRSNDLLLVDPKAKFESGKIFVVRVAGESTVKRVFREPGGIMLLRPDNRDFDDDRVKASACEILGRVIHVIQREVK